MAKQGTFRLLLLYIDGDRVYADAELLERIPEDYIEAARAAWSSRSKSFGLLAERNWSVEYMVRRVRWPSEIRGLFQLPEGEAVDRLLGWEDDAGRWHQGIAGLQPAEARAFRMRVVDRLAPKDIAWALGVKRGTVDNHLYEGHRKLRKAFGLPPRRARGVVFAPAVLCPQGTRATT